jgi:outer membrane lipoprotein-sorting protein
MTRLKVSTFALGALLVVFSSAFAQEPAPPVGASPQSAPAYTPKFKGDPARSDSEAAALAYMRVVIRANKQFNKQYGHYALNLNELVHSGSFTKRMVNPDRGDYTASYKGKKDSYLLTMTPKALDAQHRSFYADDDGKIRADETKPAGPESPILR